MVPDGPGERRGSGGLWVLLFVLGVLAIPGWFFWAGLVRPWRMTDAFFAEVDRGEVAAIRERIVPDQRAGVSDPEIRGWTAGLAGRSGWELARKASSLGRTRGGRSTVSLRGYVHYPGSTDERYFSVSFIDWDGTWYVNSFSLFARATPR